MLVIDPVAIDEVRLADRHVSDLASELPKGALLVVNDTRVLSARLFAKKPETGGKVEIFLVRSEGPGSYERAVEGGAPVIVEGEVWRALGKASKPLRFDQNLEVGDDLMVRILGRASDDGLLRVLLVSSMATAMRIRCTRSRSRSAEPQRRPLRARDAKVVR